jgi:hypothetical protein
MRWQSVSDALRRSSVAGVVIGRAFKMSFIFVYRVIRKAACFFPGPTDLGMSAGPTIGSQHGKSM